MTFINGMPSCFYHPVKTIFLDNHSYDLDILTAVARGERLSFSYLKQIVQSKESYNKTIRSYLLKQINVIEIDALFDTVTGFKMSNILNVIYNKRRFDHIAVLIIDYECAQIEPLTLLQQFREKTIYTILLVSESNRNIGIQAFNQGLIHQLIVKSQENLYRKMERSVDFLTTCYFNSLSKNMLEHCSQTIYSLFNNIAFNRLFAQLISLAHAVEYYLIDCSGSFLFLDQYAHPTWLIIKHTQEIEEQLALLQGYNVPEYMLNAIAKKEKILLLLTEKEYKKPIVEWMDYLFDAMPLDGDYYYSIIKGYIKGSVDWEHVAGYADYCNTSG